MRREGRGWRVFSWLESMCRYVPIWGDYLECRSQYNRTKPNGYRVDLDLEVEVEICVRTAPKLKSPQPFAYSSKYPICMQ